MVFSLAWVGGGGGVCLMGGPRRLFLSLFDDVPAPDPLMVKLALVAPQFVPDRQRGNTGVDSRDEPLRVLRHQPQKGPHDALLRAGMPLH